MMDALQKLMAKKKQEGDTLSDAHKNAKTGILHDLMNSMMNEDADKLKGLKKVTVASNSPEGLQHGLDKAKELVQDQHMDNEPEEKDEHAEPKGEGESPDLEEAEHEVGNDEDESSDAEDHAGLESQDRDEHDEDAEHDGSPESMQAAIERLKAKAKAHKA